MNHLLPPERPIIHTIPRSAWLGTDAAPPYIKHKPARIIIHHSESPTVAGYSGNKTIKAIYDYHTKHNGWTDVGYHYMVSPDGSTIFEGRPADRIGSHCGGSPTKGHARQFGNTGSIGICLIGNYETDKPTTEALRTLAVLIFDLCEKWNIDPLHIYGHCEAWQPAGTKCPGEHLYKALFGDNRWNQLKSNI